MKRQGACISGNDHKLNKEGSDLIEIKCFSLKDSEVLEVPYKVCEVLLPGDFLISSWNKPQGTG